MISYSGFSEIRGFSDSAVDGTMDEGARLMTGRFLCLRRSGSGSAIDVRLRGGLGLSGFESWMTVIDVRNEYIVAVLLSTEVQGLRLDVLVFGVRPSAMFGEVRRVYYHKSW